MKQVITKRKDGSIRIQHICEGESLTRQEFAAECDINNIIKKHEATGILNHLAQSTPVYADVSDIGDFRDALDVVQKAQEAFAGLPADVRREFENDPAQLVDFISNPENRERAEKLGLLVKKQPLVDQPADAGTPAAAVDGTASEKK